MILRKPYAFFIKHFKLFHLIMLIFLGIITYRTNLVRNFFNEYLSQVAYVIQPNIAQGLFSNFTYLWAGIVIVASIVIFIVMNKKEKPVLFYALNMLLVFSTVVFLIYSQVVIHTLQSELMSQTILRAVRDISNILVLVQTVFLIVTFVRATGFDIKKFDFGKDLSELNISEEDSEEYEVQFDFDKNDARRNLLKNRREFKYFLLENKKMIIIFISLILLVIGIFVYVNFLRFSKTYSVGTAFQTEDFLLKVTGSYMTQNDYKGSKTTDNILVAVGLEIQGANTIINTSKTQLKVGDAIYYPVDSKYNEKLIDLGKVYNSEQLSEGTNNYVLVYEIPEALKDKKISFSYLDNYTRTIFGEKFEENKVKLNPINIDENKTEISSKLGDKMDFNSDFIKGNLTIINYELKDMFVNKYNTCIKSGECYDLNQYLQPSFTGYEDKTILKINGNLNYDDTSIIKDGLFDLISKYGKIVYVIDNKPYSTKSVKSTNFSTVKDNSNYYAEVPKEIEKASRIDIVINVRNSQYIYNLK